MVRNFFNLVVCTFFVGSSAVTILSESVGRGGFFQFTGSFSVTSSNGSDPQTASFYLPTTFYNDVRFSSSAVFLIGATGSLQGTASGNFASASI
jgi:hypothetical protein